VWLADVELLSAGFGPLWLPPTNARCVVLVPVFKYNSFGVIYDAVKGRTIKSSLGREPLRERTFFWRIDHEQRHPVDCWMVENRADRFAKKLARVVVKNDDRNMCHIRFQLPMTA